MQTSLSSSLKVSLVSSGAAQGLFGLLGVAAVLVAMLEGYSGVARPFDTWACLLLGAFFAGLALAVWRHKVSALTAQRVGAAVAALFVLTGLQQAWFNGAGALVDPYAVASGLLWMLGLSVLIFLCVPRLWAATAVLAMALASALMPWLSAAPADPGLRVLSANALLAQVVMAALFYGVSCQVQRLARMGQAAGLDGPVEAVPSVSELVTQREAGLRRLLRQSEEAHLLALRHETELRTMLNAFPGVVLRIDGNGTLSYCNERAASLLGLPTAELEGRHARTLLGEEGYQRSCSRALQVQASGSPASFELGIRHVDGSVRELLMTQFVVTGAASGAAATYQIGVDIAERKRAEAALARAKADAERANRAKSRFMSSMSHELRTPLNAVLGLAQLLRAQGVQAEAGPSCPLQRARKQAQQQLHLRTIADAGKDLLALVDETLDLSRIDAGDMHVACQPVNLADLVCGALNSVGPLAAAQGVTLAPAPCVRGLWVQADPVRLRQVLLNLLSNAIKYNRIGGGVAVRVVRRGVDAQLVVQDTGHGLTPQQQAQLFQPFNRLGAERSGVPGTGIGLSIARGLVGLMHGRMDVRSQPGVGSEFIVWLPSCEAPAEPAEPPPASNFGALDEEPGLQGSLLYVEDNEVNVLVFEACLARRPGVKLHVARDGAEALALVARVRVDLVVLDLNLPDQSGLDLADALSLHKSMADVPLVLLTADATAQTLQRAKAHGIQRVWHKPFDAARLLREVDELLKVAEAA